MTDTYQLFEDYGQEQYDALAKDIAKRGVLVPIEVDEEGNILDGHHRLMIADSLGIECPKVVRMFGSEDEKVEHVLKINLLRRHLGPVAWAKAFDKLLEARGIERGQGQRNDQTSATLAQVAEEVGVPLRTAQHRLTLKDQLEEHPDLSTKLDRGEINDKRAMRVVRERAAEERAKELPDPDLPPELDVRHCSIADLEIPKGSADLIFTDPPYEAEYLPAWSELGAFAKRCLKPGSLLIAYSGQYHLPKVLEALSKELSYVWLGALYVPGAHNMVQRRKIRNLFKPLLIFSNGPYKPEYQLDDFVKSEQRDKEHHEWQQSAGAARYFIERLTKPNQLVVDPFLGSGTTALVCKELHRSFIGCDVDPIALAGAKERLAS